MRDADASTVGQEDDRPALDVACLDLRVRRASLVSTTGNHCRVWRSARKNPDTDDESGYTEFVIKYPVDRYDTSDARILSRQHRLLRDALGEIIPEALFVISCIDGKPNLFVIAEAEDIWFNIANPSNREEAIGLLRDSPIAQDQLSCFVRQALKWREGPNPRLIDLYGLDNLVMNKRRQIRYVDSYYVFFFEDMLHLLGGERDLDLEDKIAVSLNRLAYLEEILSASAAETP